MLDTLAIWITCQGKNSFMDYGYLAHGCSHVIPNAFSYLDQIFNAVNTAIAEIRLESSFAIQLVLPEGK